MQHRGLVNELSIDLAIASMHEIGERVNAHFIGDV